MMVTPTLVIALLRNTTHERLNPRNRAGGIRADDRERHPRPMRG